MKSVELNTHIKYSEMKSEMLLIYSIQTVVDFGVTFVLELLTKLLENVFSSESLRSVRTENRFRLVNILVFFSSMIMEKM